MLFMLGCDLHPQQIKHHSSWHTQAPAQCGQEQQHNCVLHTVNLISGAYKPFQCKMYVPAKQKGIHVFKLGGRKSVKRKFRFISLTVQPNSTGKCRVL